MCGKCAQEPALSYHHWCRSCKQGHNKQWMKDHRKEEYRRRREWRDRNRDRVRVYNQRRKGQVYLSGLEVWAIFTGECYICLGALELEEAVIDHVVPVSRGGSHELSNLQLVHPSCNQRKYNKLPEEIGVACPLA